MNNSNGNGRHSQRNIPLYEQKPPKRGTRSLNGNNRVLPILVSVEPTNPTIELPPDDGQLFDDFDDSPQNLARQACHERKWEEAAAKVKQDCDNLEAMRAPWVQRAGDLATWTLDHLVNRRDVWGQYKPLHMRDKGGKALTEPPVKDRDMVSLERGNIVSHYQGEDVAKIIGLHSTSADGKCRWVGWDIDHHDDDPTRPDRDANWRLAQDLYTRLRTTGLHPLLTESDGTGGYHLRVVFTAAISSEITYRYAQGMIANVEHKPETFPKQSHLRGRRLGNWLRLPGRHHTRTQFTRVWSGEKWLDGKDAIDAIVTYCGDDPQIIISEAEKFAPVAPPAPAPAIIPRGEMAVYLRQILQSVPVQHLEDYSDWVRVGMAIHHTLPNDDGLSVWDEASRRADGYYESGCCEEKWPTFSNLTGTSVTVGTLIHWIRQEDPEYTPPRKPQVNQRDNGNADAGRADEPIEILTWAERLARNPNPQYLPVVIDGLVREQETITYVSGTKIGKSWVAMQLALCVASGKPWFGMQVAQGRVLLVDCELHDETTEVRLKRLANAMNVDVPNTAPNLTVVNLRKLGWDLFKVRKNVIDKRPPGHFKLIVLDCLYKLLPDGVSELEDKEIRRIYTEINRIGTHTKAAIFVVHHTGKGSQIGKKTTDVGNGPSAGSRAGDIHCSMLATNETTDDVSEAVFRAAVRSFPPFKPRTLRRSVIEGATIWQVTDAEDQRSIAHSEDSDLLEAMKFAGICARPEPEEKNIIIGRRGHMRYDDGRTLTKERAIYLFGQAKNAGFLNEATSADRRCHRYARAATAEEAHRQSQSAAMEVAAHKPPTDP